MGSAALAQSASPPAQREIAEGVQLLRDGQTAQAMERFDAAVKLAPRSADALTWRGVCENQAQQYTAAATDFRAALRVNPSMLAAHYNLALSLIRLKETDAAIEQLRTVVAAEPKSVQALYNLAILLTSKGSLAEARKYLDAAHALAPDDQGVTLHLLVVELRLNEAEKLPPLVSALSAESTKPEIQREAGTALLEAGRFADAVSLLRPAHSDEPAAREASLLLARALIGNGNNGEAVSLLAGMSGTGSDAECSYLLGLAHVGAGELQKAADNFEVAARLKSRDPRPLYHLGLIASSTPEGQNSAVKLLRSAAQLEPGNPVYGEALARVLLASDQADEAKAVLVRLPAEGANDAQRRTLLGTALAAQHQVPEAIQELGKAIEEDPKLALANNVLGFCLFQQGEYAKAAVAYGRASELEPGRLVYARDAARAYERANDSAQALHYAERAKGLGGTSAADHALLGKLYAASGHKEDAVRELRRATELDPELDSAVYLLARTYMQMGDQLQATQWSEKLATLKQRHEAAFALQKKSAATAVRSSALLQGGAMSDDEAGKH